MFVNGFSGWPGKALGCCSWAVTVSLPCPAVCLPGSAPGGSASSEEWEHEWNLTALAQLGKKLATSTSPSEDVCRSLQVEATGGCH